MILMKGATKIPPEVTALVPMAVLNHTVVDAIVLPPPDDDQALYEPGPEWLESAFNSAYDLIETAEDVIDYVLANKRVSPVERKRLLAVREDMTEFLRFYEGEDAS